MKRISFAEALNELRAIKEEMECEICGDPHRTKNLTVHAVNRYFIIVCLGCKRDLVTADRETHSVRAS